MSKTGIVIVDHGSRRTESNQMLEEVARLFGERFNETHEIVEPAHMEICEPSIATAYAACVKRGATRIMVLPFFLGPGKHWTKDIPALAAEAASGHPGTQYHVAMPLGIDDLILDLLNKRAEYCQGNSFLCDSCRGTIRSGEPGIVSLELKPHHDEKKPVLCSTCPFQGQPIPQSAGT